MEARIGCRMRGTFSRRQRFAAWFRLGAQEDRAAAEAVGRRADFGDGVADVAEHGLHGREVADPAGLLLAEGLEELLAHVVVEAGDLGLVELLGVLRLPV